MSDFQKQYALWDEFLSVWPAARLATMTLDEYSLAGSKDSFTYWIESRLDELGSIWGGSSFKFGVFSLKNLEARESAENRSYSDTRENGQSKRWRTYWPTRSRLLIAGAMHLRSAGP